MIRRLIVRRSMPETRQRYVQANPFFCLQTMLITRQQFMFSRYPIAKPSASSTARSTMQSPSQPLKALQNTLLAQVNQGINKPVAKSHSHIFGYQTPMPVGGASTKVHEGVFSPSADTTPPQGSLPHPSLSEHPDRSNLTDAGLPAESVEGSSTNTPAQAAGPPHVGRAPFTTPCLPS